MKKVLFSLIAVILVVGLMGSAFAYFSDTESSTANTFTTGTLSLVLGGGTQNGDSVTGTWVSPSGWAPGDSFQTTITVQNTGNIDGTYLGIDWHNLTGYGALSNVIQITYWWEYVPGYGWTDELGAVQHYATLVGNGDNVLTLNELMKSYSVGAEPLASGGFVDEFGNRVNHLTDSLTGNGYDTTPVGTPAIAAGQTYQMIMGFTFMASAGNEYQNKTCGFDVSFMIGQDMSQFP